MKRFLRWLFPEIRPLHGRGPHWVRLVGGPADGKKFKLLALRVGDTLSMPVPAKLTIADTRHRPYLNSPYFNIATYRVERGPRRRMIAVYKGMRD